jgi:hypothetical protein
MERVHPNDDCHARSMAGPRQVQSGLIHRHCRVNDTTRAYTSLPSGTQSATLPCIKDGNPLCYADPIVVLAWPCMGAACIPGPPVSLAK